ncbi:MAG: hypothetical protein K8L91_19235 [Anaerolineae bacterium]|nr:hypothetical protein [Anaerolineae bacterium]
MMTDNFPQPDASELLDYLVWHEKGFSLLDFARQNLSPDLAISITKIFWPDFVLDEGRVFRKEAFDVSNFEKWKQSTNADLIAIQKVMNHIHLASDFLYKTFENLSYANILYFGTILTHIWKCALETTYPDLQFEVSIEKDLDFDDVVITFWQPNLDL